MVRKDADPERVRWGLRCAHCMASTLSLASPVLEDVVWVVGVPVSVNYGLSRVSLPPMLVGASVREV